MTKHKTAISDQTTKQKESILKPAPGFKELEEARILLAYLKCGDCSLQYCRNELGITNPLEIAKLLQFIGKKSGFKISFNRKSTTLRMTDNHKESFVSSIKWIITCHFLAWRYQSRCSVLWFLKRSESFFVGNKIKGSSLSSCEREVIK